METLARDDRIQELRTQWKSLWGEKFEDKVRAEGIAKTDYSSLFVDRGTVIFATRNFNMPSLRDILKAHGLVETEDEVFSNPYVGGWGKFIRSTYICQQSGKGLSHRRHRISAIRQELERNKKKQQPKKGGRGWLHK